MTENKNNEAVRKNQFELSKLTFSNLKRSLKFRIENKIYFDQWILLFHFGKSRDFKSLEKFDKIIPPKDRFWTDPHIFFKNNIYYIFFEEYFYKNKKGHISLIKMDEKGNYSNPTKILEEPFHLSYPFIFEYQGELYMVPETHSKKTIQTYRCTKFPEKWEFHKILFKNIDAVDSTIFFHDDKWWMFTGIASNGNLNWDHLCLFYSEDPLSCNWIPHLKNPITSDKRNSRPAGGIFINNGSLFRPAQNSSDEEYGKGIVINQIELLNEREYLEEKIDSIEPSWDKDVKGIHTINSVNKLTIFDAKLRLKR